MPRERRSIRETSGHPVISGNSLDEDVSPESDTLPKHAVAGVNPPIGAQAKNSDRSDGAAFGPCTSRRTNEAIIDRCPLLERRSRLPRVQRGGRHSHHRLPLPVCSVWIELPRCSELSFVRPTDILRRIFSIVRNRTVSGDEKEIRKNVRKE